MKATKRVKELFSRKRKKHPAPRVPKGSKVLLPDEDGVEEQVVAALDVHCAEQKLGIANGQSFMIEYVDCEGQDSARRISVWGIKTGEQGVPVLAAMCLERQAPRSFRIDRIKSVIDYDGTVHEPPAEFFSEIFGMAMDAASRTQFAPSLTNEDINIRRQVGELVGQQARLLAALSHSDGFMSPAEVGVIVNYLAGKCANAGMVLGRRELNWLHDYVKRLLPDDELADLDLDAAFDIQPQEIEEFIQACWAIVQADGEIDEAEVKLLNEICVEYTGHSIV